MSETPALERLLRRDRIITIAGLVLLCALAWAYVAGGAGLGMSASTAPAPMPPAAMDDMAGMPGMADMPGMSDAPEAGASDAGWSLNTALLVLAMWWIMMIAMMTPSAAPTVLLYARTYRHAAAQGQLESDVAPTGAFVAGYLLVWLLFSAAAAALQWAFVGAGLVSDMMESQSRWLTGGLLVAAGAYQLSPLKSLCLSKCRSPAEFLTRNWRPGSAGAARLGVLHGAYCVGCCWALMALLFVGGVMNLVWIAALTLFVLIEKLAPGGAWVGRGVGAALLVWGLATLFL